MVLINVDQLFTAGCFLHYIDIQSATVRAENTKTKTVLWYSNYAIQGGEVGETGDGTYLDYLPGLEMADR